MTVKNAIKAYQKNRSEFERTLTTAVISNHDSVEYLDGCDNQITLKCTEDALERINKVMENNMSETYCDNCKAIIENAVHAKSLTTKKKIS